MASLGGAERAPLAGVRIIELAGIGPGPHAGMLLADLGADLVRIERPGGGELEQLPADRDPVLRGRRVVTLELPAESDSVLRLVDRADVLIEGFRPGTAERLGVGPDACRARNERLVYARVTGWGQDGPLAGAAGHDLNYLSVTGALHAMGRAAEPPPVPLNLIGDYGGGSAFLVIGVLAALLERSTSGRGQVVDVAMIDGIAALLQPVLAWRSAGRWTDEREHNILDGAAPFYRTYACSDGAFVAVASIETRFYMALLDGPGTGSRDGAGPGRPAAVAELRVDCSRRSFARRTRDEWAAAFAGTDACVTPVLTFAEAPAHRQIRARGTLAESADSGRIDAAPAPRFARTATTAPPPAARSDVESVLRTWT